MYAVIETGGKQYRVQEGDVVYIEKLDLEDEAIVTFDKVFAIGEESGIKVGTPLVEGATVTGKVLKSGRAKKIIVFKYKAKKNVRKRKGHRQSYTKVQIETISA